MNKARARDVEKAWEKEKKKKISRWQHTSSEFHLKANKWPTYASIKNRADSHMENLPSEGWGRPWYVERNLCRALLCGLVDIPFWLITRFAPVHPLLSAWGTFFPSFPGLGQRLMVSWGSPRRSWLCPFALSFCGKLLSLAAKLHQIIRTQLPPSWELLPVTGSGICRLFWQSGSQYIFINWTDNNVRDKTCCTLLSSLPEACELNRQMLD